MKDNLYYLDYDLGVGPKVKDLSQTHLEKWPYSNKNLTWTQILE